MESNIVIGVIVIVFLFLFILALYWQYYDLKLIDQLPQLNTLPPDQQRQQLEYGSCYPYQYQVTWRPIFISSTVATLMIWGIDYLLQWNLRPEAFIFIFAAIVIATYIVSQWISFHIYRTICLRNSNQPDNYNDISATD